MTYWKNNYIRIGILHTDLNKVMRYYRKTSSISRDLYQKLNLKNYQVIYQS